MNDSTSAEASVGVQLYTTAGCHLCEQAAELLEQAQARRPIVVTAVEISSDPALVDRYGIRIPVVRRQDGAELGWPFALPGLLLFISGG